MAGNAEGCQRGQNRNRFHLRSPVLLREDYGNEFQKRSVIGSNAGIREVDSLTIGRKDGVVTDVARLRKPPSVPRDFAASASIIVSLVQVLDSRARCSHWRT